MLERQRANIVPGKNLAKHRFTAYHFLASRRTSAVTAAMEIRPNTVGQIELEAVPVVRVERAFTAADSRFYRQLDILGAGLEILGATMERYMVRYNPYSSWEVAVVAAERLRKSHYKVLTRVSCECRRGILFLRGRLFSLHEKQVAQEAVASVDGVVAVVNEIEVV